MLGIFLGGMMMLGLIAGMSLTAYADVTHYNLWVGNTEVTSGCLEGDGWTFAPRDGDIPATLTLNGVTIEAPYDKDNDHKYGIFYNGTEPLTIEVAEGSENVIRPTAKKSE